MRIIVTGGGTGGHIIPALATLTYLTVDNHRIETLYIGSIRGLEAQIIPQHGFPFKSIATGKIRRSSRGRIGLLTQENIKDMFSVPLGFLQALRILNNFKPDVVFSTGGYVALPASIAAWCLGIPLIAHEQTTTIGLANRISSVFCTRFALSFGEARADLPRWVQKRSMVTGNPIRPETLAGSHVRAIARFACSDTDKVIFITGGALGAAVINQAVAAVATELLSKYTVIHQCGLRHLETLTSIKNTLPLHLQDRWKLVGFMDATTMADAWAIARLVVSRAGAGTVNESLILRKPMIFVPLVPTSRDEQTKNALRSVRLGVAQVIKQAECTGPALLHTITNILDHPNVLEKMATVTGDAPITDATSRICKLIAEVAGWNIAPTK